MPLIFLLFDLEISNYAHSVANFTGMTKMGLNYENIFSIKKKFVKIYLIEILWNDVKNDMSLVRERGEWGGGVEVYSSSITWCNMYNFEFPNAKRKISLYYSYHN